MSSYTYVGSYSLQVVTSLPPFAGVGNGGPMTSGTVYTGTNINSQTDVWTFSGSAGDSVTFSVSTSEDRNTFDPLLIAFQPDGTSLDYYAVNGKTYTLPQSGTYVLFVDNDNFSPHYATYAYTLSISDTPGPPGNPAKADGAFCKACQAGGSAVGDPVNTATGDLYEELTDYSTAGSNPLAFIRYYNSFSYAHGLYPTALGVNWRSNYDRYLRFVSPTVISAERADGQVITFNLSGGVWTPDSDVDAQLTNSGSSWTLTDSNDVAETYTVSGILATLNTIKQRNGYTQSLTYTGGQLTRVTDSYGRALTLSYTNGLLTGVTTPDTLTLTYAYTATVSHNVLTSISYNTSPITSQTYLYYNTSFPFALTGILDENGGFYANWAYDATGRAISSQHFSLDLTSIRFDDATGDRTVTGPLGIAETYKFVTLQGVPKLAEIDRAANGTVAAATRTFTYDSNGYLATATDWNGNITQYTNNSHGLPATIVEAAGSPVARTTTIVYDTTWPRLPHTITTAGLTSTFNYDSATGNLLSKVLADTTGQSVPYSTNGQTRTTTYSYTATGQLSTAQLPRTDVAAKTTYTYTGGALSSTVDALGHTTTVNTSTGGGLPLTITDPDGVLTTLGYDARLRLHTKTVATSGGNFTTIWDHDAAGNLTKVTQPDGTYLSYAYDDAHQLINTTNANGEAMPMLRDGNGDVVQVVRQTSLPSVTWGRFASFDALGRKLTDETGLGATTTYGYDNQGNVTSIKTPLTWTTSQTFDALNRLQTSTDPYSHATSYSYDAHDRPLTVTAPNGAVTSYVYDGFGDVIQQTSPDTGITIYRYDQDGNLTQKVDALSVTANYIYDALDRCLTVSYPAATAENVAYTYDQSGHGFGVGHLTSMTDPAGTLSRSYDERGNITAEARAHGAANLTTSYTYNAASRLASITYPSGATVNQARDTTGRINALSLTPPGGAAQTVLTGIAYRPFGPASGMSYGNGVTESRIWDFDYRLTNQTDIGAGLIQKMTYSYDADDNPVSINDVATSGINQKLGYDHLDRLVSASGAYGVLSYAYDANGNRTSDTGTAYSYMPNGNRLTAVGAQGIATNADGNITQLAATGSAPVVDIGYYNSGRLATVSEGGSQVLSYLYDGFGQRLTKLGSATGQTFDQYGQTGELLETTDTLGSPQVDYIYLDGRPVATFAPATGMLTFLHTDRLGTPRRATNSAKSVVWSADYQPFGYTATIAGTITQALRLPGQEFEVETGFYHNGFRDYVPALGRYLESDPIGLQGGLNTYSYARGNPQFGVDPIGLLFSFIDASSMSSYPASTADQSQYLDGPQNCPLQQLAAENQNPSPIFTNDFEGGAPTLDNAYEYGTVQQQNAANQTVLQDAPAVQTLTTYSVNAVAGTGISIPRSVGDMISTWIGPIVSYYSSKTAVPHYDPPTVWTNPANQPGNNPSSASPNQNQ